MKMHRIATIPADCIGPEVIAGGMQVLEAVAGRCEFRILFETMDWGSDYYKKHGVMMPDDGMDRLKGFDAIYFDAVGAPDVPDHITLWGSRLPICQGFDQYAKSRRRFETVAPAISTGSLCEKIRRANIQAMAAAPTRDFPKKWGRKSQSSPEPVSRGSCAMPFASPRCAPASS